MINTLGTKSSFPGNIQLGFIPPKTNSLSQTISFNQSISLRKSISQSLSFTTIINSLYLPKKPKKGSVINRATINQRLSLSPISTIHSSRLKSINQVLSFSPLVTYYSIRNEKYSNNYQGQFFHEIITANITKTISLNDSLSFNNGNDQSSNAEYNSTYSNLNSDSLSFSPTFSANIIHNQLVSQSLIFNQSINDINDLYFPQIISFNQSINHALIVPELISHTLVFNQILNYGNKITQTLPFIQTFSKSVIHHQLISNLLTFQTFYNNQSQHRISQTLSFNQKLNIIHPIHQTIIFNQLIKLPKSIRQALLFNQAINHSFPIHYRDFLSLNQLITINSQRLILKAKSNQFFILPRDAIVSSIDQSFANHGNNTLFQKITFTLSNDQLIPFRQFLNYNRSDPFTLNDKVAYLRSNNNFDLFDQNNQITLSLDVVDGKF